MSDNDQQTFILKICQRSIIKITSCSCVNKRQTVEVILCFERHQKKPQTSQSTKALKVRVMNQICRKLQVLLNLCLTCFLSNRPSNAYLLILTSQRYWVGHALQKPDDGHRQNFIWEECAKLTAIVVDQDQHSIDRC